MARENDVNRDVNRDVTRDLNRTNDSNRRIDTYQGTVKSLNRGNPSTLVVTTDRGELGAELAPATYLDSQHLTLDPNTSVTVRGYETMRNGYRTFIATELVANGQTIRLRGNDSTPLWTESTVGASDPGMTVQPTNDTARTTAGTYASSLRDVTGTVSYLDSSGPCGESIQGRQVTIRASDGTERVVALGPGTFLDSRHWTLRPNDTVTIRGYDSDYRGNRVFMATEVRRGTETWRLRNEDGTPIWR